MIQTQLNKRSARRLMPLVMALQLTASAVGAGVDPQGQRAEIALPENPTYFYDAAGRRDITVSETEFVARVRPMYAPRHTDGTVQRPALLGAEIIPDALPPSARRLEAQMTNRRIFVVRDQELAALRARPEVEYALPLIYFTDSEVPFYPSDQVIVRLQPQANADALAALAAQLGCRVEKLDRGQDRYLLTVENTRLVHPISVANYLHERNDLTMYAAPNLFAPKVTYAPTPIDDPYYHSHQWHLDGDVLKGADAGSDINVEQAWDTIYGAVAEGSPTVHVAIIDECVEMLHPDLFPNWRSGIDVDDGPPYDDFDPSPDSYQRHGTACAGLAVAKGNNIGVRGVSPNSGLIGIKFFGGDDADTAYAFLFAMDPDNNGDHSDGAAILSNSWGYGSGTYLPADVVNSINIVAQQGRNGKGALVLFASANNDHTVNGVQSLGSLPTVTCVGGTNSHALHTEFSDVGPEVGMATPTNDRGDDGVRLPWLDITTVDNTGNSGYNGLPDLDYTNGFGGTSAATPIAAGCAALVLSHDETMTAATFRSVMQHTAVRIDEPYGRFDPITSHSHRYGYGRLDMGAAVAAAAAGLRWPDRIPAVSITPQAGGNQLVWSTPSAHYASSLVVRSDRPFAWKPTDGVTYNVNDEVAPGVFVIYNGAISTHTDLGAISGAFFYAVYARSNADLYGFGARNHIIRDGVVLFQDNSETADPGWSTGGVNNEWQRGTPTSALAIFSQAVSGSGPLAGLRGVRAINGNKCWGTDLFSTYAPNSDAWLETPVINLTGVTAPVILEYYDWCLLETYYDKCTVEVVDGGGSFLGYLDADTGGDYDWTQRSYDLTPFAGQPIKVRFRIQSDGIFQRDGWFIDEVKISVAQNVPLPPTAVDVYQETPETTPINIAFIGSDPNPSTTLGYYVATLPAHGDLFDPFGGQILAVPYKLNGSGSTVDFVPDNGYQGPDAFSYYADDGALQSNVATVKLSIGTPLPIYSHPLSTNPNWVTEGQWAWGVPLGSSGDPSSGFSGAHVYGYNLGGDYPPNLPAEHLTMPPFNCTGLSRVTLDFYRWLGVESGSYDNASIEATNDGVNWITVWRHTGGDLQETSWSLQSYNLSTIADNQPFVQVRWTMGPTDGGSEFSGWNIDDVVIKAIGTAPANQPPLAWDQKVATAIVTPIDITLEGVDPDDPSLEYTITALPAGGTLTDPNGGVIGAVPYTLLADGDLVTYTPNPGFDGFDTFAYRVTDGEIESNEAEVTIHVLDPAPFPYELDFETGGPFDNHWLVESTGAGRVRITSEFGPIDNYHVTLDSGSSTYSLNQITLTIDLENASSVLLYYDWKDFNEEANPLPGTWTGTLNGDGVAISADGETWHRIAPLYDVARVAEGGDEDTGGLRDSFYQTVLIDLDQAAANAGVAYNQTFRIRFQQYDNGSMDVDGIALDNLRIVQGTDYPTITMSTLPSGKRLEPYGPVQVATIGGDLPLIWSMPIEYSEDDLGASDFSTIGAPQGWQGDDLVFDFTLPFAFPFFDGNYTNIKVGTDGWINFAPHVGSTWNNSTALLQFNKRIAVLWDSLIVDAAGDIYIDTNSVGQCTIRWDAITKSGSHPVNFAATLYDDGRIRLDYGDGNSPITATVGVSAGDPDGARYFLMSYNGAASLGNANSLMLDFTKLPPGLSMDSNGVISGTPQRLGTYYPQIRIEDQRERFDQRVVPITILSNVYGDYDQDGDADLTDLTWLTSCLEAETPSGECVGVFDSNGNEIVDLGDFAKFQLSYTGPQ